PTTAIHTLSLHDALPICQASYTTSATAFDRFRLRLPARIGMASWRSRGMHSSTRAGRPRVSEPKISASPLLNLAAEYSRAPLVSDRKSTRLNSSHDQISY